LNKFKIRVNQKKDWHKAFNTGILKPDARLWKDEYIYETELTIEEVKKIPGVVEAVKIAEKRPGPGRPPVEEKRKVHNFKATDDEWRTIQELAAQAGESAAEYIRRKALAGD